MGKGEEYVVFVKPEHIQIDDSRAKIITVEDKKKQELQDSIIPRPIEALKQNIKYSLSRTMRISGFI